MGKFYNLLGLLVVSGCFETTAPPPCTPSHPDYRVDTLMVEPFLMTTFTCEKVVVRPLY